VKATGIYRKLDSLGRIVIPKELRDSMGLKPEDKLEIYISGNNILLRPGRPKPEHTSTSLHAQLQEALINLSEDEQRFASN
jgi:AbrB family looped-hinge helix DNA binding protein